MNYKDFNLGDWIGHISGAIEDERELDGNEMRDLVVFLSGLPKWVSVSERLPEFIINNTVSEDVLVFDGVDIRVGEYRKGKYLNGAGYWRVYGYELEEYVDVIAWMPLPKPYEPQESEVEE